MEIVLFIIIGLAVLGILVVVLRKIPQLRVIDVSSIPKERARKKKEELILSRFKRSHGARFQRVGKASSVAVTTVSKYGRRAVQRLYRLEQYYQKLKRNADEGLHAYSEEQVKERLDKANEYLKQDEHIPAEKIYIDIISHNPKSVDAYEQLGNMYLEKGQYEQAEETLKFALLLSPNDASVTVSLAELSMRQDDYEKALDYLRKAIDKRSRNPKYLDYYTEAALRVGSLKDAREGIKGLKEVNPQNKKIEEFEVRFQEKKAKYVQKASKSKKEKKEAEEK